MGLREIPPTAGLPLRHADLWPGPDRLAETLAACLYTPPLQLECSGTACLWLALRVLHARRPARNEVVIAAYTCPLVAIAAHRLGLRIRLCDTRAGHWDLDPQSLQAVCSEHTLAVVVTHLGGLVANLDTPMAVAAACGAFVIEDAAQALGASDAGQSVGLRGDVGFFSLAAGKGLSIFEGGLLVTRHADLRSELGRAARDIGPDLRMEWQRCLQLLGLALLYHPHGLRLVYGWPLRRALRRGDPVRAVGDAFPLDIPLHPVGRWRRGVGTHAAARLPAFLQDKRARALVRAAHLSTLPGVSVFAEEGAGVRAAWPLLMVLMPSAATAQAALAELWTAGLGVSRLFIHALPDYGYLQDFVPAAEVPNARELAARMLTVSNSAWLDDAAFDRIADTMVRVLQTNRAVPGGA